MGNDETEAGETEEVFSRALAPVDHSYKPAPLALLSDEEFAARIVHARLEIERVQKTMLAIMVDDVDYGVIPNTKKKSLYQPGAQKLNRFAGLIAEYETEVLHGDGITSPPISYTATCRLLDADGAVRGSGMGQANSWEKKHRYRYLDRECPSCGAKTIRGSQFGEKYYCNGKAGGCGAKFQEGDTLTARIDAQPAMGENPDPHELANTLLKMACKRSLIAVTVITHAISGLFTQDLGDDAVPTLQDEVDEQNRAKSAAQTKAQDAAPSTITGGQVEIFWVQMKALADDRQMELTTEAKGEMRDACIKAMGIDKLSAVPASRVDELMETMAELCRE